MWKNKQNGLGALRPTPWVVQKLVTGLENWLFYLMANRCFQIVCIDTKILVLYNFDTFVVENPVFPLCIGIYRLAIGT